MRALMTIKSTKMISMKEIFILLSFRFTSVMSAVLSDFAIWLVRCHGKILFVFTLKNGM
jgi:hypothetical protein